ncbi:Lysine-specific demethylase 8 [Smittium culicis]|uniref:Lysine-specific demethylase 8 n=1 Tax=Smittium culicis TaxID=133412 RepID=A0A1R1YRH3_9FUNG|nr:Lysine-specific demethylase 8 [Smittium culicis]
MLPLIIDPPTLNIYLSISSILQRTARNILEQSKLSDFKNFDGSIIDNSNTQAIYQKAKRSKLNLPKPKNSPASTYDEKNATPNLLDNINMIHSTNTENSRNSSLHIYTDVESINCANTPTKTDKSLFTIPDINLISNFEATNFNGTVFQNLKLIIDLADINFTSSSFSSVNPEWLNIYSESCIMSAAFFIILYHNKYLNRPTCPQNYNSKKSSNLDTHNHALEILNLLDLSIIIAGAKSWRKNVVLSLIDYIYSNFISTHNSAITPEHLLIETPFPLPENITRPLQTKHFPNVNRPVPRYSQPISLSKFKQLSDQNDCKPFIIQNCISHWPSISNNSTKNWSNVEYLRNAVGHYRLVPIEVGNSYSDSTWTQKLFYFGDYIDDYIINNKFPTAYLAQHDLFNQSSKLSKDFTVPDYCFIDAKCLEAGSIDTNNGSTNSSKKQTNCCGNTHLIKNIWFGPKNAISPLHYDSFHNLYAMVSGHKYVKLIQPSCSNNVYPFHKETLLSNTSQVIL